jgi:HSP20 family protein
VVRERPQGIHSRQIKLGSSLDGQAVEAGYDQGVLTVSIPVREEAKPRKISVDIGTGKVLEASAS